MSEIQAVDATRRQNLTPALICDPSYFSVCSVGDMSEAPSQNASATQIVQFQNIIAEAIEFREQVLYHKNPLCELPFNVQTEELIRMEQKLLRSVLDQYKLIIVGEK